MNLQTIMAFLLAIPLLFAACKKKSEESLPMDFSKHYSIEASYNRSEQAMVVAVKLDPLVHAYGAEEKIGKPVRLEISPTNGWSAVGSADIPKGVRKKLSGLGESVVIDGPFHIKQKVNPGVFPLHATLFLQVCTNNACDRPRVHKLVVDK